MDKHKVFPPAPEGWVRAPVGEGFVKYNGWRISLGIDGGWLAERGDAENVVWPDRGLVGLHALAEWLESTPRCSWPDVHGPCGRGVRVWGDRCMMHAETTQGELHRAVDMACVLIASQAATIRWLRMIAWITFGLAAIVVFAAFKIGAA